MQTYTKDYYESVLRLSRSSAEEIVPLILELIRPRSVVDVGCGQGDWLSVFQEHGISDVTGLDGGWVDTTALKIPRDRFQAIDLNAPFELKRQFDLVISLEVAEHLPGEVAQTFVNSLADLGPLVLFSAAIPFQGGSEHLNEQWPEYWAGHFQTRGYVAIDCIRGRIWNNRNVEWWYAQNMLLFAKADCLDSYPNLKKEFASAGNPQLSLVHPQLYLLKVRKANPAFMLRLVLASVKDRFKSAAAGLLNRLKPPKH